MSHPRDSRADPHDPRSPDPGGRAALVPALLLLVLVGCAPWTGGAMDPGWTGGFACLAAALVAILAASPERLVRRGGRELRWLGVAGAGLLALGAWQLLPLGPLLGLLSPHSLELRAPYYPTGATPLGCVALYPEHARRALLGWAIAASAFVAAAQGLERRAARLVAWGLVAGAVAQAVVGIATLASWSARASGSYPSPNHFAGLLALCLPLAIALGGLYGDEASRGRRVLGGSAAALLLLGVVFSKSRSGVVAAAVALATQAWLARRGQREGGTRVLLGALAAAGLLVTTAGWHALGRRFGEAAGGGEALRLEFWARALEIWTSFPLLGSGLRSHDELTPSLIDSPRLVDASHNDYLNLLADQGLVGVALAGLGVWAYVRVTREGWQQRGAPERPLAGACGAALLGIAAASAFEFNLQIRANLWAVAAVAGLGLAAVRRPSEPGPARSAWARRLAWPLLAGAALLAAVGVRLIAAERAAASARDATLPLAERRAHLSSARRFARADAELEAMLGRLELGAQQFEPAEAAFRRAVALRPRWAPYRVEWARAAYAAGRLETGDEALRGAGPLAPHFVRPRLEAAQLWRWRATRRGAPAEARSQCLRALADALRAEPGVAGEDVLIPALRELLALPLPTPAEAATLLPEAAPSRQRAAAIWLAREGRNLVHRHLAAALGRAVLEPLIGPNAAPSDLTLAGELEVHSGRPTPGLELWLRAYREARDPARVLSDACAVLESKALEPLALQLCERAAAERPDAVAAWLQIGWRQLSRRAWTPATEAFERAAALDPVQGGLPLGDCYLRQGLRQSAVTAWRRADQRAVQASLRTALALRIGRALLADGDAAGALAEAEAALRLDPTLEAAQSLAAEARAASAQDKPAPRR